MTKYAFNEQGFIALLIDAVEQIQTHGKVTLTSHGTDVILDYTDR